MKDKKEKMLCQICSSAEIQNETLSILSSGLRNECIYIHCSICEFGQLTLLDKERMSSPKASLADIKKLALEKWRQTYTRYEAIRQKHEEELLFFKGKLQDIANLQCPMYSTIDMLNYLYRIYLKEKNALEFAKELTTEARIRLKMYYDGKPAHYYRSDPIAQGYAEKLKKAVFEKHKVQEAFNRAQKRLLTFLTEVQNGYKTIGDIEPSTGA